MPSIKENISLKSLNTFGIGANARYFTEISSENEAQTLIKDDFRNYSKYLVLGGGSNVLFTDDFSGLVIHQGIKGKKIVEEDEERCLIKVGAGEDWPFFVDYCVDRDWGGIENLALIPGQVGASPVQNIGAYGREVKDVIESVEAIELKSGEKKVFSNKECRFGYRDSVFKNELKDRYLITAVNFLFYKNADFHLDYGSIRDTLRQMDIDKITYKTVAEAVKQIRRKKLPDIEETGSAGSFFKNPVVDENFFEKLRNGNSNMPFFKMDSGYKIPAGWLIDQCGWKGYLEGHYGVYPYQALVLVNYGGATGKEIADLAWRIRDDVEKYFGIRLQPEVTVI
ncbi:MAG: UDP-N-acetylmuramate dehydrogenase [Bacteroidales bacterium]|nr:UDP-N-acetylmuramate dehydrogenase [Bacteroidales bacterium]